MIPDTIRPALARIIGAAAAAVVVSLMRYFGRELSPDVQTAISDVGVFIAFAAYASVHKAISARTNPTDAAAPALSAVATKRPPDSAESLADSLEQQAKDRPTKPGA